MDTSTNAIAKLIAEARERSEDVLKLTPNITIDDVFLWQVAQTLEAVTTDRNNAARRINELEQRASDWLTRANNNYDALKSQLEAVTRERDNLLRRRDSDDLTINQVCAERAAVTKERDALQEALDTAKEFIALLGITSTNFVGTNAELIHAINDSVDKCLTALASRATPQEPKDAKD